jgi:hypothetical protein
MTIKHNNIFNSKALQYLPTLGFFGMKIYHLATLVMITICSRLAVPACAFGFLENNNIRVWASGQCYKMASLRQ